MLYNTGTYYRVIKDMLGYTMYSRAHVDIRRPASTATDGDASIIAVRWISRLSNASLKPTRSSSPLWKVSLESGVLDGDPDAVGKLHFRSRVSNMTWIGWELLREQLLGRFNIIENLNPLLGWYTMSI